MHSLKYLPLKYESMWGHHSNYLNDIFILLDTYTARWKSLSTILNDEVTWSSLRFKSPSTRLFVESLFWLQWKKASTHCITGSLWGHRWIYPTNGAVWWKAFPCDDVNIPQLIGPLKDLNCLNNMVLNSALQFKRVMSQLCRIHETKVFVIMMTSSNGIIFRVTGHLCGEFTGPRWIPRTKASDAELWCFLWSVPE